MKFKFEFTFEQAVLILKLVDSAVAHNQARPIVDHMIGEITAQQDAEVKRMQTEDKQVVTP